MAAAPELARSQSPVPESSCCCTEERIVRRNLLSEKKKGELTVGLEGC
jgi:hypothetical protein